MSIMCYVIVISYGKYGNGGVFFGKPGRGVGKLFMVDVVPVDQELEGCTHYIILGAC
ncbi:hypothetical protein F3Y22_tig00110321pilonHSYRG00127 [Hibiscus syriacus]|uniref:Uncharacterized protein n=1 Tax=Hibiscus syriacus TaxID=106335 RepID=A0A6A3B5S3_HIBSY|nr:hypothetical protein F3Y22_tig00110321pilonHSYRG00127 [Hibiscus syriacus]